MTHSENKPKVWPTTVTEVTPLLPFVYTAWADGVLSAAELAALRTHIDGQVTLSDSAKEHVYSWLDPTSPPTPSQLGSLRDSIRIGTLSDPTVALRSLTDLGLALWGRANEQEEPWSHDGAIQGLRALEDALGMSSGEAARRAFGAPPAAQSARGPEPAFNSVALNAYLDRDQNDTRTRILKLLDSPQLTIPLELDKAEYRARVLGAIQFLAKEGVGSLAYPKAFGGRDDPAASIAAFETLAYGDLSVVIKFGVQFGLFGGSVLQLGTTQHHNRYLTAVGSLDLPGCYAMTETGHGSNVRDLETTATYDADTDELVVNTPHDMAAKDWIGNAACHGQLATVFARLLVDNVDHGVHAILVPIRSNQGTVLDGVRIEDRGFKEGLNGVDNGRIWFDHVAVPRENLLDRFAEIDDAGAYQSNIPSSGRRFFTMLRTLVAGRVSIAAASVSAAKVGLAIAVAYTNQRRQFGPAGAEEQPLLDYRLIQNALMPKLASTYAAHFAVRALQSDYAEAVGREDPELEVAAAALKAYASELTVETLQVCREACGGQGYLAENRFAALKADTDVFTTFEGANLVLYQLVAKGLLSQFRDEMNDLSLWRVVHYLAERAETVLTELNPVVTRRTDRKHLVDIEFHTAAFAYREERLLRTLAGRLRSRLSGGMDSFDALNEVQDHVVTLARAHTERVLLDRLSDGVAKAPTPGLSEMLATVRAVFALSRIQADRGWFLEVGYIDPPKSRAIRAQVNELCTAMREHAVLLVDSFGIPHSVLPEVARTTTK